MLGRRAAADQKLGELAQNDAVTRAVADAVRAEVAAEIRRDRAEVAAEIRSLWWAIGVVAGLHVVSIAARWVAHRP